jgi:hypothetical protein
MLARIDDPECKFSHLKFYLIVLRARLLTSIASNVE